MAQAQVRYVKPSPAVEAAYWARKAPNSLVHPKQYSAIRDGLSTQEFMTRLAKKIGVWCHDCNTIYCDCICSGVARG